MKVVFKRQFYCSEQFMGKNELPKISTTEKSICKKTNEMSATVCGRTCLELLKYVFKVGYFWFLPGWIWWICWCNLRLVLWDCDIAVNRMYQNKTVWWMHKLTAMLSYYHGVLLWRYLYKNRTRTLSEQQNLFSNFEKNVNFKIDVV